MPTLAPLNSYRFITRRQFLLLLGGAAAGVFLTGCQRKPAVPLQVAVHPWPGYEFMFLAQREGDLDPEQVTLLETRSASESLRMLSEGKADAAALTLDEVLRARAGGIPLSVVLVFDISAGADIILAKPGMRRDADIKGRRIGVEEGALGAFMLANFLKAVGVRRDEVKVVPLTIDQHEQAWSRDEVDILVCYPPVSNRLLKQGAVALYDSRQIPNAIVDVLAVRQTVLKQKAAAIRHLVATHFKQIAGLRLNPIDTSYRMASHLNIPAKEVLLSFKGMQLPELAVNHRLLGGKEPGLQSSAQRLSEVMVEQQILSKPDRLEHLLDAEFLPEVEDEK